MKKHFNKIIVATIIATSVIGGAAIGQQTQMSEKERAIMEESIGEASYVAESQSKYASDKEIIAEADLPKEIKNYIQKHFSDSKVLKAEREKTAAGTKHEVKLDKGVGLEFNGKNEIVEIDGSSELPESVIPSAIFKYVKTNFPENVITDWELKVNMQEIELDSGIELKFDLNGEFLRTDE